MPIIQDRMVQAFLGLIALDTPTGREEAIADRLERELCQLGFETSRDSAGQAIGGDTGNLFAFKPGSVRRAPCIMLNAHMDTVQSTAGLVPCIEDGWIRTSGETILGADDKAGVAAIMEALRSIHESQIEHGDLEVIFTISEEHGLRGAKNLDFSRVRSRLAYVFDSGPPAGAIVRSAPTHEFLRAEFHGTASHAAVAPEKGVNAIVAASRAIARMELGRLDEESTCNVGVIEGGQATNIVPDLAIVKAEARSRNPERLVEIVNAMVEAFETGAREVGADVEVTVDRHYDGYEVSLDSPLIAWARDAAHDVGFEPVVRPGAGGSDANIFNARGIAALVLGVGYHDPHGVNERIEIKDMVRASQLCQALVYRVARSVV